MQKGMIITLGTTPGVEHAIAFSIKNQNPDYVIFIVTEDSIKKLEDIKKELNKMDAKIPKHCYKRIFNEDNVAEAYRSVRDAIEWLIKKGYHPNNIVVDYTSGTKPMSAGALFSAIMAPCGSLVYVAGRRDEATRRVISGTERVISEQPNRLLAERYISEAISLFNSYQFKAASQILRSLQERMHSSVEPRLSSLSRLCDAYNEWDSFNHQTARDAFDKISREDMEKWSNKISANKGWVNRIAKALASNEPRQRLCRELLVDLWMNANRRLEEGRFVDALARLYRLAELAAQYRLIHQYDIDTGNVDIGKIPTDMHETINRYRDEKERIRIPLSAAYQLLARFNDPIAEIFQGEAVRDALNRRNESIAAHGLNPVSAEDVEKLKEGIKGILGKLIHNLDEMAQQAIFPKLSP